MVELLLCLTKNPRLVAVLPMDCAQHSYLSEACSGGLRTTLTALPAPLMPVFSCISV